MTTTLRPLGPVRGRLEGTTTGRGQDFAVCANGQPVGSVRLSDHSGEGWIYHLEVTPEWRRRGHASVAMLAAEEVLRGWGCRAVRLAVPAGAGSAGSAGWALALGMGYRPEAHTMVKRLGARRVENDPPAALRPLRSEEFGPWAAAARARFAVSVGAGRFLDPAEANALAVREYQRLLPEGVRTPRVVLRVLEEAGEPVGTLWVALFTPNAPGRGWVYDVFVEPSRRGRGVGRVLMRGVEWECARARLVEIGLNVFADNHIASRLYTSLGYAVETSTLRKSLR